MDIQPLLFSLKPGSRFSPRPGRNHQFSLGGLPAAHPRWRPGLPVQPHFLIGSPGCFPTQAPGFSPASQNIRLGDQQRLYLPILEYAPYFAGSFFTEITAKLFQFIVWLPHSEFHGMTTFPSWSLSVLFLPILPMSAVRAIFAAQQTEASFAFRVLAPPVFFFRCSVVAHPCPI